MCATGLYSTRNESNIMFSPRIMSLEVRRQWNQMPVWRLMPLKNTILSTLQSSVMMILHQFELSPRNGPMRNYYLYNLHLNGQEQ